MPVLCSAVQEVGEGEWDSHLSCLGLELGRQVVFQSDNYRILRGLKCLGADALNAGLEVDRLR